MKKKYLICVCIMLVLSFLAVAAKEESLSDTYQSQYKEYEFWTSASKHMHGLLNSWNSLEYRIE